MFCPHCSAEYLEGFTTCADCAVPLVDVLPPEPGFTKLVTVLETTDHALIMVAKSILDGAGIPYYARFQRRSYLPSHKSPNATGTMATRSIRLRSSWAWSHSREAIERRPRPGCLTGTDTEFTTARQRRTGHETREGVARRRRTGGGTPVLPTLRYLLGT